MNAPVPESTALTGIISLKNILFEDGESPVREIQRVAGNLRADLIVVSTHDRAWLAKYLFYSDADELARWAAAPVLVFRAKQDAERSGL